MKTCPYCGTAAEDNAAFCVECGKRFADDLSHADSKTPSIAPAPTQTILQAPKHSNTRKPGKAATVALACIAGAALLAIAAFALFGNSNDSATEQTSSGLDQSQAAPNSPVATGMSSNTSADEERSSSYRDSWQAISSDKDEPAASGDTSAADEPAASDEPPASNEPADPVDAAQPNVYESESIRTTTPAPFADAGYTWNSPSNTSVVFTNPEGVDVVRIVWAESANYQDESLSSSHVIGVVSHGSQAFTAIMRVYYFDEQGKYVYAGIPDAATAGTLATDLMGISEEELASWIELRNVDSYVRAQINPQEDGVSQSAATSHNPFWGVWIGASKDAAEAADLAEQASSLGLNGAVFVTTDWDNLNDDFWYVVSAGSALSEDEAQAMCDQAISAGYPDAYVKYSGDYQG